MHIFICMKRTSVTELSAAHAQWLKGLEFYRDEISILEKRLQERCPPQGHLRHAADIEHYQNQCILQRNLIDELRHAIREHASHFGHAVSTNEGKWGTSADNGHASLQERYLDFERQVNALRHSFYQFLTQGD